MPVLPHLGTGLMGIVALVEAIGGGLRRLPLTPAKPDLSVVA